MIRKNDEKAGFPMVPKKERSPWLWLIPIPIQLVILALTFFGGIAIDAAIFSHGSGEAQGHGMPIFTIILPMIALVCTGIVVLVCVIGLIVSLVRRGRRRRAAEQIPVQYQPYQPQYQPYQPTQTPTPQQGGTPQPPTAPQWEEHPPEWK